MRVRLDTKSFQKDMANIIAYSRGFIDGVNKGKMLLLQNLGMNISIILNKYVDSAARLNPEMLHHIYEWYQTGQENARLFDIDYIANATGISFGGSFRQSTSIANGSKTPFYDKARIMENGIPVVIRPVNAQVLAFTDDNGEEIFTSKPVTVFNPGGENVQNGFSKIWNQFFNIYLSQSFLQVTGLSNYFNNPRIYKQQLSAGKRFGKSVGFSAGLKWVANAGRIIAE